MLALARGEGQSIIIDGHIEVKVVKWSRSSVRLAIQAPREVAVDRDEIWRKMHPGEQTPLEKAEAERNERFAREGGQAAARTPVAHGTAGEVRVAAPVAGVFQMETGPGGGALVMVGGVVEAQTRVGTIQAADGTVTEVLAGVRGTVMRVLVAGGQAVTAGQGLVTLQQHS